MLAGDFTAIACAGCSGRQITLSAAAGFVNNTISPSAFSPIALKFLEHVPVSTDPCGRLQDGIPNNNTEHQTLGRGDYSLSPARPCSAATSTRSTTIPGTYDGKNALTLSRTGQNNQVHSFVGGHNWVLSATMVNAFHVTWNKTINDRPMPEYFSPADLGAAVYSPQPGYMGVSVTNGFNIGTGGTNPGYFNSDSLQLANDIDIVRGRHQLSFGGNWIRTKIETVNNRPTNGQFTFNGQTTGLGLADFMLGRVSNFVQGNPVYDFDENDYVGAYVQDEWKLRPNLTLNVGLRWEPYLAIKNSLDYVSNFDEARFDAGIRSTVYPQAPAGLLFPGDEGFPGSAAMNNKLESVRAARRHRLAAEREDRAARRLGPVLRHAAPLLQHAVRQQPAVGRADHAHQPGGRLRQSVPDLSRRQSVPGAGHGMAGRSRSRRRASTSTRRSTRSRRRCSSGTSARSGRSATGC